MIGWLRYNGSAGSEGAEARSWGELCVCVAGLHSQWRVAGEVRQLREYGVTRRHTHIDWTHRGMGEQLVSWLFSC